MTKYIQEIQGILDSFNLISESTNKSILETPAQDPSSDINIKEVIIEVYSQSLNEALINVFKKFNYSLISGEYISNSEIKTEIEEIVNKLSETVNISNDFDDLQVLIFELVSAINIAIEAYRIFILEIENKFSREPIDYLFSFNQKIEKQYKNVKLPIISQDLISYFFNNLLLSEVDHFPSIEDDQFETLFRIDKRIENLEIIELEEISKLIKLKIGFLEHKWKARKQEENPSAIFYLIDGKSYTIEEFKSNNVQLNEWYEIINSHYQLYITSWAHNTEKRIKLYKDKPLEELSFLQIHQLIKYYKDVKKAPQKLKEISNFLFDKTKENNSFYDSYTLNIISNYALNNKFSLFLESNNDINLIKNEYNNTKDKIKGEVNNFFLEFKYLNALLDILDLKINEKENLEFLEYERIITNECKLILDKYFTNKEWSKKNNNYIFQLPFKECLVEIENNIEIKKIFIASSFLLPPDNNKIEIQYNEIRQKHKSLSYHINTIKRLRGDLNKIDELNKAFDKRDFKSIEIISIFTAIITFVLTSVPAYKFIDTTHEALLFMLSLATALAVFVTLILFSTRDLYKQIYAYIPVVILLLLSFFGYCNLTTFEKEKIIINSALEKKLDSVSTKKVDSLILKKTKPNR